MLPDLEALLDGYTLYAKRHRFSSDRDEGGLADALHEAAALAGGHEEDEPAALFFTLTRRPRTFGKAHGRMTIHLAVEHARALGLELTVDVAVLELMRARILREPIDFEVSRSGGRVARRSGDDVHAGAGRGEGERRERRASPR